MNTRNVVSPSTPEQVGPFTIRRALPNATRHAIGPFVLIDHAPARDVPGGLLPAHPHAGIEVMSYVIDGAVRHLDSLGHDTTVRSGGVQFMASGNGILHAEELVAPAGGTVRVQIMQLWTRTTRELQEQPARYVALDATDLPVVALPGGRLKVLAGTWPVEGGVTGPTPFSRNAVLAHLSLAAGSRLTLPLPVGAEVGAYVLSGDATLAGHAVRATEFLAVGRSEVLEVQAGPEPLELVVLGGDPIAEPLVFGGPFVFESDARMRRAYADYRAGRMGSLLGVPF